jgi:hypothetical protein
MALDDQLTPDQLDEMIGEIDTDGSGTVDFEGESVLQRASVSTVGIEDLRVRGWGAVTYYSCVAVRSHSKTKEKLWAIASFIQW